MIKLFLAGDVMTGRGIDQILPHPCEPAIYENNLRSALEYVALAERAGGIIRRPAGFDYIWGAALGELSRRKPHVRIVNLETAVTAARAPEPKGINYRMNPANIPVLAAAEIDCCMLSNNHVRDWGEAGLIDTLQTLKGAGILTAGAGRNLTARDCQCQASPPGACFWAWPPEQRHTRSLGCSSRPRRRQAPARFIQRSRRNACF